MEVDSVSIGCGSDKTVLIDREHGLMMTTKVQAFVTAWRHRGCFKFQKIMILILIAWFSLERKRIGVVEW